MSTPDPIESSSLGRWWWIPTGEKMLKKGSGILGGRPGDEREYNYTSVSNWHIRVSVTTTSDYYGGRKRTLCLYSFIRQQHKGSRVGKKLKNNWKKSNVFTWCWNSGWSLGRCHQPAKNSWPSHNWQTSWRRPDSFQFRTRGQDTGNIKIKNLQPVSHNSSQIYRDKSIKRRSKWTDGVCRLRFKFVPYPVEVEIANDVELWTRLVERHLRLDTGRQELHRRYKDDQKLMDRHF